ncbi:MAG: hypothetical protein CM1200mP41_31640 [Gammaproteobacteria bacterium]|nr:MAG: hypothetical protein CM1200mP41_31640 [Gammaproteobacteria bacterium]
MSKYRVGADIGGTFTDIVFLDSDGRLHTKKISSNVSDYAKAIIDGIEQVFSDTGLTAEDVTEIPAWNYGCVERYSRIKRCQDRINYN